MIQTKRTQGKCLINSRIVSTVYRVRSVASIPLATIRLPSLMRAALASLPANGAIPSVGFSGLPGDTSSQT